MDHQVKIARYYNWKSQWSDPDSLSVRDYISFNIHPEDVLLLGSLFLPKFIEIDECIFLSDNYNEENYNSWRNQLSSDFRAIEKVINHVHIYDIFANCTESIDDVIFQEIGKLLQLTWSNHLRNLFPSRNIIVEYYNDEHDYGPTLTVYQG